MKTLMNKLTILLMALFVVTTVAAQHVSRKSVQPILRPRRR